MPSRLLALALLIALTQGSQAQTAASLLASIESAAAGCSTQLATVDRADSLDLKHDYSVRFALEGGTLVTTETDSTLVTPALAPFNLEGPWGTVKSQNVTHANLTDLSDAVDVSDSMIRLHCKVGKCFHRQPSILGVETRVSDPRAENVVKSGAPFGTAAFDSDTNTLGMCDNQTAETVARSFEQLIALAQKK